MLSQRDIVLISFPFSNLENSKVRPVLVISNDEYNNKFNDFIAVPLTSNIKARQYAMKITNRNLENGTLVAPSQIKVDKIFSVNQSLVRKKIGKAKKDFYKQIKDMIVAIID
jgi:mRNA interferase MazF